MLVRYLRGDGSPAVGLHRAGVGLHHLDVHGLFELAQVPLRSLPDFIESRTRGLVAGEPQLVAPIDGATQVWASGVTYLRSRTAREEESQVADVYARVYDAQRPELFLKAVADRVVGPGRPVGIRDDSKVNVPEPELGIAVNAVGEIFAVTVCNDVSSRSIEGENPLYLPQAKIYSGSCAIGPGLVPVWEIEDLYRVTIAVAVTRDGATAWQASTSTSLLHRRLDELVEYLFRGDWYDHGVILSTGTGVVPDLDFTLREGDVVRIDIEGVGTLTNPVALGKEPFRSPLESLPPPGVPTNERKP
jgi:2-dehydro-3-deoxy-D-arabinonate dehydratase